VKDTQILTFKNIQKHIFSKFKPSKLNICYNSSNHHYTYLTTKPLRVFSQKKSRPTGIDSSNNQNSQLSN